MHPTASLPNAQKFRVEVATRGLQAKIAVKAHHAQRRHGALAAPMLLEAEGAPPVTLLKLPAVELLTTLLLLQAVQHPPSLVALPYLSKALAQEMPTG